MERDSFFGNFVGSISGLSFYASAPGKRHPLVVLHLFVLGLVVLAAVVGPLASHLIMTTDRYVRYYDEGLPEMHIVGNKLSFVGLLPAVVQLESGAQIVIDTTGAYVSADSLPRGSVLLTNRALEVRGEQGVRRYSFDLVHAAAPIIVTPRNVHALKGQFLAITIALFVVGGSAAVFGLACGAGGYGVRAAGRIAARAPWCQGRMADGSLWPHIFGLGAMRSASGGAFL